MPKRVSFEDVVEHLVQNQKEGKPNNLLIGNGFNLSLGVDTSYKAIFSGMSKENIELKKIESIARNRNYDVEKIIEELGESITGDEELKQYFGECVTRTLTNDFVRSTVEIAGDELVKGVFWSRGECVVPFLSLFSSYFSTNFDPLLYYIFLGFGEIFGEPPQELLDAANRFIRSDSSTLYKNTVIHSGTASVPVRELWGNNHMSITSHFIRVMEKQWKQLERQGNRFTIKSEGIYQTVNRNDINTAIRMAMLGDQGHEGEVDDPLSIRLHMDDGFRRGKYNQLLYQPRVGDVNQNVFYLHGAFHLIRIKEKNNFTGETRKCTSDVSAPDRSGPSKDKSLFSKIKDEVRLHEDCLTVVLRSTSQEKVDEILDSKYLHEAFEAYQNIDGTLVILGCSLAENDVHLLSQLEPACKSGAVKKIFLSFDGKENTKENTLPEDLSKRIEAHPAVAECTRLFSHREIKYYESCRKIEVDQGNVKQDNRTINRSLSSGRQLRLNEDSDLS